MSHSHDNKENPNRQNQQPGQPGKQPDRKNEPRREDKNKERK